MLYAMNDFAVGELEDIELRGFGAEKREPESLLDALDRLERLSDDALLSFIGAESLTPREEISAAVTAYASSEVAEALDQQELVLKPSEVELAVRGRRTARRIVAIWGDQLREKACPLWAGKARLRDLALEIAGALLLLLALPASVIAAISLAIAKFLLDELCGGTPVPSEAPASA